MQLRFLSSFPSWKSPSLGTGVPVSQVFTNLPTPKVNHTPQDSFPIFWMKGSGHASEHLFQNEAQCQSVDKWLRGGCCWGWWGCPWWAGGCNFLVMFMGPGLRTESGEHLACRCCAIEDLRGLAPWNLPSFGFCEMRSGSYKSKVTNGEACRFLSRNPT